MNSVATNDAKKPLRGGNEHVTLLAPREAGKVLTKRYSRMADGSVEKVEFDHVGDFVTTEVAINSLLELFSVLNRMQPDQCIIRGRLRAGCDPNNVRRTSRTEDACFEAADRRWAMLDFDRIDAPADLDLSDPEAVGTHIVAKHLPAEFMFADWICQLSSGHLMPGNEGMIKAHLWVWLDRPVSDGLLKTWFGPHGVDLAPFSAVQPHYVAPPILDGVSDPCPTGRLFLQRFAGPVAVPADMPAAVEPDGPAVYTGEPVTTGQLREMLAAIPPDCDSVRDTTQTPQDVWLAVGAAIRHANIVGGDGEPDPGADDAARLSLWKDWSSGELAGADTPANYQSDEDWSARWRSFDRPEGAGVGSVYEYARRGGYDKRPPWRQSARDAFANVITDYNRGNPDPPEPEPRRGMFATVGTLLQRDPPRWLIRGVMPCRELTQWFGDAGSLKSYTLLDLALSVATGQHEWCGQKIEHRGKVVWLGGEGVGHLPLRVKAWLEVHELLEDDLADFHVLDADPGSLGDSEYAAKLTAAICNELSGAALVVVDTQHAFSTDCNENSATDMGRFLEGCALIQREAGAHVAVIHHVAKHDQGTGRGSNAVHGRACGTFKVEKKKASAGTLYAEVRQAKAMRDGRGLTEPVKLKANKRSVETVEGPEEMLVLEHTTDRLQTTQQAFDMGRDALLRNILSRALQMHRQSGSAEEPASLPASVLIDQYVREHAETQADAGGDAGEATSRARQAVGEHIRNQCRKNGSFLGWTAINEGSDKRAKWVLRAPAGTQANAGSDAGAGLQVRTQAQGGGL